MIHRKLYYLTCVKIVYKKRLKLKLGFISLVRYLLFSYLNICI